VEVSLFGISKSSFAAAQNHQTYGQTL
jgi:hypothetical protein